MHQVTNERQDFYNQLKVFLLLHSAYAYDVRWTGDQEHIHAFRFSIETRALLTTDDKVSPSILL